MVAGPLGLGDVHDPTAQAGDDLGHERVAVLGEPEPGADEPLGAPLGVGQGDERVEHRPARVPGQRVQPGGARHVGDDRVRSTARPRAATSAMAWSGVAMRTQVDAGGRGAEVVVAPEDRQHLPAGPRAARWRGTCRPGRAR